MKSLIIFFMILGSYAGSFLPIFWGGSLLSLTSIFSAALGGFLGIWIGYKLAQRIGVE